MEELNNLFSASLVIELVLCKLLRMPWKEEMLDMFETAVLGFRTV